MTANPLEFDFYISANSENPVAQEVARVLREAGYSIYLPDRQDEVAAKRFVASKSKTFVLPLVNDSEQNQFLADILNFAPLGVAEGRVVVIQFEECELASLIDFRLISNLSGLTDSRARKLRIIDAVEISLPKRLMRADQQPCGQRRTHRGLSLDHFLPKWGSARGTSAGQKVEEVNPAGADALKEHAASSTPSAAIGQSEPALPQQYERYEATTRPMVDVLQQRSASSTPRANIDQSEAGPIYETGDPAIDDPLTTLLETIPRKIRRLSSDRLCDPRMVIK